MVSWKKKPEVFISQTAESLEQEINLRIKYIIKTDETYYEIPCISGIRGRRKRRKLRRWVVSLFVRECVIVCVCVCMCVYVCMVSLAALRVRFPVWSGGLVVSLYDTHEADATRKSPPNLTKPNLT
jgi:hypothetical protein